MQLPLPDEYLIFIYVCRRCGRPILKSSMNVARTDFRCVCNSTWMAMDEWAELERFDGGVQQGHSKLA